MDIFRSTKIEGTLTKVREPILETLNQKILPGMKDFSEKLCCLSEKYLSADKWTEIVEKSAEIMNDVVHVLGVECDSTDELGFKIACAEKTMSDFDTIEEYINYLRNDVEIDKEKFDSLSIEQRMVYMSIGMSVEVGLIAEKLGMEISPEFAFLMSKIKDVGKVTVDTVELISMIKALKENNITESQDVVEYFLGVGESNRIKTGIAGKEVFQELFKEEADNIIESIKMEERNS